MTKLMVLGGNSATAGAVQSAKILGAETIVVDINPCAYAKMFADKSYDIDGTDVQGIVEIARKEKVDGVLLGAAEELMDSYRKVCEGLGLPCYADKGLFGLFSDKRAFKELCMSNGVPATQGGLYGMDELGVLAKERFPLIVKPKDSSGSRGIRVCYSSEELPEAASLALTYSRYDKVLVERYLTGQEVVVYYAFQDGNPVLLGMCDRYTNHQRASMAQLPTSYIFPSRLTRAYIGGGEDLLVKDMFRKAGVRNGVMFLQGFEDGGLIRFYESGYRLNGAQEHYIIAETCGIDAKEMMIRLALGRSMADFDLSSKADPFLHGKYGCKLSVLMNPGRISGFVGLEEIGAMEDVVHVSPSYLPGSEVKDVGTLKQIACRFFIVSETKERLKYFIDEVNRLFDVLDEDGRSMLMESFDTDIIMQNY